MMIRLAVSLFDMGCWLDVSCSIRPQGPCACLFRTSTSTPFQLHFTLLFSNYHYTSRMFARNSHFIFKKFLRTHDRFITFTPIIARHSQDSQQESNNAFASRSRKVNLSHSICTHEILNVIRRRVTFRTNSTTSQI